MVTPVNHDSGPCIVTFPTRTRFYFLRPTPKMVHMRDITHSLSLQPRFLGHTRRPYSVLEHSYQVALEVLRITDSPEAALCAAFHDGEEAYTGDLPGPIKEEVEVFRAIADRIKATVLVRFKLEDCYPKWEKIVKDIDDRMLHTESIQLSHGATWEDWSRVVPHVAIPYYREELTINLLQSALSMCNSKKKAHRGLVEDNLRSAIEHLKAGGDANHHRDVFTSSINNWLIATDRA